MQTRIHEIGADIYRLSIFVPEVVPPAGFTFNRFLILGDEPLLSHCGLRKMFPLVSEAVAKIIPVDRLRWLTFGHFEADECGSMNEWLAVAPHAQLAHGVVGCRVSVAGRIQTEALGHHALKFRFVTQFSACSRTILSVSGSPTLGFGEATGDRAARPRGGAAAAARSAAWETRDNMSACGDYHSRSISPG